MTPCELLLSLRPLLAAECAAEAPGTGLDPDDLAQDVWVRLLTAGHTPDRTAGEEPARWVRQAVRHEVRAASRRAAREVPVRRPEARGGQGGASDAGVEEQVLRAQRRSAVREAVQRLPGRCPVLLVALLSHRDLTYQEIARELGISQGSLGPMRSRCMEQLRRMLATGIAAPERWGMLR